MGDGDNAKLFATFNIVVTYQDELKRLKQNALLYPAERSVELFCKITRLLSPVTATVLDLKAGPLTTCLICVKTGRMSVCTESYETSFQYGLDIVLIQEVTMKDSMDHWTIFPISTN